MLLQTACTWNSYSVPAVRLLILRERPPVELLLQVVVPTGLHCTLYETAPLTADQLSVAVDVVTAVAFNPEGVPQLWVLVVVKFAEAENAPEALLQTACT